jgi:co-chaperonin GroES (HSP10)
MTVLNDKQLKDLASTPLSELSPKVDPAFPAASAEFIKLKAVPISERVFYEMDPLWKWVAIRKVEREVNAFGEGGAIVGAIDAGRSQVGIVESVSDLCVQKRIQVGDRVMFTNYVLMLPDIEEATGRKDLFLVREEEIYCILRPKAKAPQPDVTVEFIEAAPEPASVEAV